jgi:hypothetical protein
LTPAEMRALPPPTESFSAANSRSADPVGALATLFTVGMRGASVLDVAGRIDIMYR